MKNTRQILAEAGCILEGDFFFALKKHGLVSKKYINVDPILTQPWELRDIVAAMVDPFLINSRQLSALLWAAFP